MDTVCLRISRGRLDFLARAYRAERFQSRPLIAAIALVAELTANVGRSRSREWKNSLLSSSKFRMHSSNHYNNDLEISGCADQRGQHIDRCNEKRSLRYLALKIR